jgi:hypothetical protein
MGLFRSRIEKMAREQTETAVQRAETGTDPIERTLGPDGVDQVREAMAGLERFGIHLDTDDALGLTPTTQVPDPAAQPNPATAAAAPTAAAPPALAADPIGEVERLAGLHASGALTDEEFAAAKKSVIEG